MRHPEIVLIPLMLLSDYFLTLAGARAAAEKHRLHFRLEHYELNPIWQESVAKLKWFNPRHLVLVALVTAMFLYLEISELPDALMAGLIGVYFGAHGSVIGKHLSNLILFRRLKKHPDEIRGEVFMAHSLVLSMSQSQYLGVLTPLLLLALFTHHPMVIGAACGTGLLFAVHGLWGARARRAARRARPAVGGAP
jgi:hypothetical protein